MKKWPLLGLAAVVFYAGSQHAGSPAHAVTADVIHGSAHGGTLDCAGLERLWAAEGGSRSAAFLAAEIAMAESGGRQYATDTNGGRSTDRGYFQINSVHGALSTYDPAGNAKAAVIISNNGRDWSPWVTFNTGAYRGQC